MLIGRLLGRTPSGVVYNSGVWIQDTTVHQTFPDDIPYASTGIRFGTFSSTAYYGGTSEGCLVKTAEDGWGGGWQVINDPPVQWHEDQPDLSTGPYILGDYAVRANGATYNGTGGSSVFRFGGYDLITTYASTPTPWMRLNTNEPILTIDRHSSAGNGTNQGTAVIEIAWNADKTILGTATFDVAYTRNL